MKTSIQNLLCCLLAWTALPVFAQTTIIPYSSTWKYLDNNTRPTNWNTSGYSDATWASGLAELGYGDGDEATVVSFGGNSSSKYITTYFRQTVSIPNASSYSYFTMNVKRDDGIVVYVNGTEIGRENMPTGTVAHSTLASSALEDAVITFTVPTSSFVNGNNTIAVEVHQANATSSDISFSLELIGVPPGVVNLTRGPYLQMGNKTEVTFRWRTNAASDSRVELGTAHGTYPIVVNDATPKTEHEIRVTGLLPDTKYFYRIGSTTQVLQSGTDNFVRTAPNDVPGRKLRFAVFGDCGRNDNSFQTQTLARYQSYLTTNGIDAADAWLLLGDNAYSNGTDAEYTSNFFNAYGSSLLKNHKVYPAPGNHDYAQSSSRAADKNVSYFHNFTMPTAAQCGGLASGTEAYYSYDIGDVHFLSLDSYGLENGGTTRLFDTTGAQVTWIKNDLAANTRKWVVAYWHHAPFTMTSHNSDTESELINIRFNFVRILERLGVDLILCGHSHAYERSYLLNGYYGNESSFDLATHARSSSNGRYDGSANSCPYMIAGTGMNQGTVYVVAGSSGADGGVQAGYPHNAMPYSVDDGGMFYFEVDDNRLDAKFIRRDGTIGDQFSILQDVARTVNVTAVSGNSVTLTASWPGNYVWNTGATTRSITVTPPSGSSVYTVRDAATGTCITDGFNVSASGVLPVELKEFQAQVQKDKVQLNWTTLSESGNRRFIIERSGDARQFEPIGSVEGGGNSTSSRKYSFVDHNPLFRDNYYRLKQVDVNAHISYSAVRRVLVSEYRFALRKLLTGSRSFTAEIELGRADAVSLRVFDLQGRKVAERTVQATAGTNTVTLNIEKGTYIVHLINSRGRTITERMVIH